MKTLVYLILLLSLVTGCASGSQAVIEKGSIEEAAAPEITQPVAKVPLNTQATVETTEIPSNPFQDAVILSAYDLEQKGYALRPVDPSTGETVQGFEPIRISRGTDYITQAIYSPDGSKLAAVEYQEDVCESYAGGVSCYPKAIALHLVELASWQAISTTLPSDGWAGTVTFNPIGDQVAIGYNREKESSVLIFDSTSGKLLNELVLGFRPEKIAFYQGGSGLLAYGSLPGDEPGITQPGPLHLDAYAIPSGERLWELDMEDVVSGFWCLEGCEKEHGLQLYANWAPAIVLSPDGNTLYIYHADQDRLTRISLEDGSREDVDVRVAQSWIERLLEATAGVALAKGGSRGTTRQGVISPDGNRLYILTNTTDAEENKDGFWEPTTLVTELQVIDPHNGQLLARKTISGYGIRLTPDGKHLFIDNWLESGMDSEILDAESLERVSRSDGWELAFSPDIGGEIVLLGKRGANNFALYDQESFQPLKNWKYFARAYLTAMP